MLFRLSLIAVFILFFTTSSHGYDEIDQDKADVMAVVDLAMERISAEDVIGWTDLMMEGAVLVGNEFKEGHYEVKFRSYQSQRESTIDVDIVERGFDPTVLVSRMVAVVWYPYDIYVSGKWSHCGVDIINLVRSDDGWRIASMTWSVEQPPACRPHPDGAPKN